jgi:hypothetical protein
MVVGRGGGGRVHAPLAIGSMVGNPTDGPSSSWFDRIRGVMTRSPDPLCSVLRRVGARFLINGFLTTVGQEVCHDIPRPRSEKPR